MSPYSDYLKELAEVLIRIASLHTQDIAGHCRECLNDWPCRTYQIAKLQGPA